MHWLHKNKKGFTMLEILVASLILTILVAISVVYYGRFMRKRIIPIKSVRRIEKCRHLRLRKHSLLSYLLIIYDNEKYISVMPVKEDEFLETLTRAGHEADSRKPVNH